MNKYARILFVYKILTEYKKKKLREKYVQM